MFHKPFHVKSQTVLKGSERKKIKSEISNQIALFTHEIIQEIIPQKSDVQLAKIALHSGDHATVLITEKQPIFFEQNGMYYPTVYTAWKYPECINYMTTWPAVITKLYSGADLMLPGVVFNGQLSEEMFSYIKRGAATAVNCVGNKAALAVGEACLDGAAMFEAGMRGKGIAVKHYYGDYLWAMGTKISPPNIVEHASNPTESGKPGNAEMEIQKLSICVDRKLEEKENLEQSDQCNAVVDVCKVEENHDNVQEKSDEKSTLSGFNEDEKLKKCFYYAIKKKIKKAQLPILASVFFRDSVMLCCPPGESLDLKKTSYKKLVPFLTEMHKQGFIVIKETAKGVHSIVDINPAHPEVVTFVPWSLPDPDDTATASETQEYQYEPPEIIECLAVNAQTFPLFSKLGLGKGDTLNANEMRNLVTDYVKQNELQHETNKQLVKLDQTLTNVLINKKEGLVENLKWPEIFERLINLLSKVYEMRFPTGAIVTKKGEPTSIKVAVETRTGNKKVTIIRNLDGFGIDPKLIAKDLRSTKACSTSVQEVATGLQVLAQGNHASFIQKLLKEKYRIPVKYLDIPL